MFSVLASHIYLNRTRRKGLRTSLNILATCFLRIKPRSRKFKKLARKFWLKSLALIKQKWLNLSTRLLKTGTKRKHHRLRRDEIRDCEIKLTADGRWSWQARNSRGAQFTRALIAVLKYLCIGMKWPVTKASAWNNAVQFVKDGPSFGAGKVSVNAAFGDDLPDDGADDPIYGNETDDTGF